MDYLNDKVNSFTGQALSAVSSRARKRKDQQQEQNDDERVESEVDYTNQSSGYQQQTTKTQTIAYGQSVITSEPFGGELSTSPHQPPIGFRPEILTSAIETPTIGRPKKIAAKDEDELGSRASLYEGDAWSRLWFQRVMVLTLIRLLLFIRKIYEDFHATKTYSFANQSGHFLISAATLFLPTIVFTFYRVARYLQITLPTRRVNSALTDKSKTKVTLGRNEDDGGDGESRSALMGRASASSQHQPAPATNPNEEDGLITASQTPTNLDGEQFHDSKSQQEQALTINIDQAASPAPSTAIIKDSPPEGRRAQSVEPANLIEVDRVTKQFADRKGARVVIGTSEQLLHGVLFIFWQLKRQVDVLGYLVERACLWRKPRTNEQIELERLRTGSDGLEWFQDFYAAFLAILAQVYTLGLHWNSERKDKTNTQLSTGALLASAPNTDEISGAARGLANAVGQQVASNLQGTDLLIMSQLVVSSAVVFSLLVAVRRRDDGSMTLALSMLGWGSVFASRIIIIALAFVHIGWRIMLPLVICHTLGITGWIYKIALDSHNGKAGESEEHKWDLKGESAEGGEAQDNAINRSIELAGVRSSNEPQEDNVQPGRSLATDQWSSMEHLVLLSQIITLFALPSLFYWPIMFNLKLHCRPFKYLLLIMVQNFILIPAIWYMIPGSGTLGQWYLLGAVGGFSIVGFLFLFLYVSCKPSLTEYFARADELFNEAERSGIYYEFCSRVFKMPDLSKHAFKRLMNQSEDQEVVVGED